MVSDTVSWRTVFRSRKELFVISTSQKTALKQNKENISVKMPAA